MTSQRRPGGDGGASLLIVLVFMILVSVLALSLLTFTQASFDSSDAVREARQSNYATDAATELAISNVVKDPSGDLGTPYGPACAFALTAVNDRDAAVECTPLNGAGGFNPNRSINALLTLSTTVPLTLAGTEKIVIDGRVYSNAGIDADNANNSEFRSLATVTAEGNVDCSNPARVVGEKGTSCNAVPTPAGDDPGWSPRTLTKPSPPALPPVALCPPGGPNTLGHSLTFTAGTYTTSPAVLASAAGCNERAVLHFLPGNYYFENVDFDLRKHRVVGGTASGTWPLTPASTPLDGTACNSAALGVQFLFGGTTRIHSPSNSDEPVLTLCAGPRPADAPAIALFGLSSGLGGMVAASQSVTAVQLNNKPNVYVRGAVYLPTSRLRLTLHNRSRTLYNGGITAKELTADVSRSSTQADSPISLPACTPSDPCRSDRRVVFTARVGGDPLLRTVVKLDDQGGAAPATATVVEQWSNLS